MPLLEMKSNLSFGAGDQSGGNTGGNTGGTPVLNEPTPPTPSLTSAVFAPVPTRHQIDASVGRARLQSRLVTPTTDLSAINKNFGSNTFTAGNTPSFPHNELNVAPTPTTLYLDKKLDFAPIFSLTNKATNTYNLGDNPTPLQQISTIGINGLNNYATIPNQYGFTFTPLNNSDNKFPTTRPTTSLESRLYFNHQKDREINAGFTRNALGLDNYYAQNFRQDTRLGKSSQPKVIRGIGQRWESADINISSILNPVASTITGITTNIPIVGDLIGSGINNLNAAATRFIDTAIDRIGEGGSAAFGRGIGTFINRYKADAIRIGEFANPTSTYAIKQGFLHRQNKYDRQYTKLMGFGGDIVFSTHNHHSINRSNLDLNPQVFNSLSTFSIPGVPGMMFNRHGRNIGDTFSVGEDAATAAIEIGSQIFDSISTRAYTLVNKLEFPQLQISFKGIEFGGGNSAITNGLRKIGRGLQGIGGGIQSGLQSVGVPALPSINILRNKKVKELGGVVAGAAAAVVGGVVAGGTAAFNAAKKAQEFAKSIENIAGDLGKANLAKLDQRAFEDIGIDKVNLIPYGETAYKEEEYGTLDHIPFKFVDARQDKPIVFRAILSGITDSFSPEYSPERYVGRPDMVYVYQGTTREISFNFDVYPKSDAELVTLWEKLNYLAGLTYPDMRSGQMIAPFSKLTIGQMYIDAPGYISSLVYTVQDNTTWEVDFAKLPKYIQVACTFNYIGNRLPTSTQKHFDVPWVAEEVYSADNNSTTFQVAASLLGGKNSPIPSQNLGDITKGFLKNVGL